MSLERLAVGNDAPTAERPPSAAGIERRGAPRFQTRTAGLIYPVNGFKPVPCVITDISASGARIEVLDGWFNPYRDPQGIGEEFRLVMRVDRLEVPCAIVRIVGNTIGVRFVRAQQPLDEAIKSFWKSAVRLSAPATDKAG